MIYLKPAIKRLLRKCNINLSIDNEQLFLAYIDHIELFFSHKEAIDFLDKTILSLYKIGPIINM